MKKGIVSRIYVINHGETGASPAAPDPEYDNPFGIGKSLLLM
jgi:hypothetical protein